MHACKLVAISLHLTAPALAGEFFTTSAPWDASHISHGKVKCVISMEVNLAVAINIINISLSSDPAIPLLGILAYKYTCVSTTSLFYGICCSIICNGKRLKQHRCLFRDWLVHMVEHYTTVKGRGKCFVIIRHIVKLSEGLRTVVTCMCVWRGGEAGLW